jgi:hypothetical protein
MQEDIKRSCHKCRTKISPHPSKAIFKGGIQLQNPLDFY